MFINNKGAAKVTSEWKLSGSEWNSPVQGVSISTAHAYFISQCIKSSEIRNGWLASWIIIAKVFPQVHSSKVVSSYGEQKG